MEHDIRNAVKGFDKKLVSDIAKHLFDNMKLANINPKAAVVGDNDKYLDKNGTPVGDGKNALHILPPK